MFTTLVRAIWNLQFMDINKIKQIQLRAAKIISELTTLEKIRLRGKLIENVKYFNGFTNTCSEEQFDRNYYIQRNAILDNKFS